jgi:hypothetical protein
MWAIPIQQCPRAIVILYQYEILSERPYRLNQAWPFHSSHIGRKQRIKLFGQSHRLPKAPLQQPTRCAGAHLREANVLFVIHGWMY